MMNGFGPGCAPGMKHGSIILNRRQKASQWHVIIKLLLERGRLRLHLQQGKSWPLLFGMQKWWFWWICHLVKPLAQTCTFFFPMGRQPLGGLGRLIFRGFTITQFRHTTLGKTPLDEWPVRRRDLYLTTHNTHNRQTSMSLGGIRTHNPSKRAAVGPRLRPRGHWDRRPVN
jgi:hypothetical protein